MLGLCEAPVSLLISFLRRVSEGRRRIAPHNIPIIWKKAEVLLVFYIKYVEWSF
jgi:hypothetical protein